MQRGWSKPFEELTREDYETFCGTGNGHQGGLECDPERDLDTVAWNAANMGHLPMLRYCVEKMGADPNYSNHYHMSMLLMTGRFGHDSCLRYLCSKLTKEQIDHTSGGQTMCGKQNVTSRSPRRRRDACSMAGHPTRWLISTQVLD